MRKGPSRLENLATLRTANADGAFANAFAALVTGSILVGYIKFLGGSDIWIGLLAAVPSLLGLLQIPGALWATRFRTYKQFVLPGGLAWRVLYSPLILLPFLPISNQAKLYALAICVSVASASVLIVNSTYNDWLAEMVPAASRGYFYSRRNALGAGAGALSGMIGGFLLDAFKSRGHQAAGFTTVFALGSLCSAISFFFFTRMKEMPRPQVIKQNLRQALQALSRPLVDRNFRALLLFLALFLFGQTYAGNLFAAFALESLHLPFTIIQTAAFMQAMGTVVSAPFWGFLSDKYGNKPILVLVGFGVSVTPIMWLLCFPDQTFRNTAILLPLHFLIGAVWAGVGMSQFNIVLATAPPEDRANYIGVALAMQAIVGFIAPLLGAQTLTFFRSQTASSSDAYKMLFLATMASRFVAVFFLIPVVEQGAIRIRTTLRDLSRITPRGYAAMKQLAKSTDIGTRESAIASVAQHGLSLAGDELIKALHDPSPRIRRQAALSLARLREPNAVEALIHQLNDHPDLVEEETVEALGQLGGPEAVEPLSRLLKDPRSLVRRAAARALGRVGEPSAIPALVEVAGGTTDGDLKRSSLQALRSIGASDEAEVFASALMDPLPSVRIAAAEGVAELGIRSAAENLRASLDQFHDEASSECAYALGAVGNDQDIRLILEAASECVSIITRRRCLLGLARLLGVEAEAYRLLLLDGMGRDAALLDLTRRLTKRSKRLSVAIEKFSAGEEGEGLEEAAAALKQPILHWIARTPVEEVSLVVMCYLARSAKPSRP